MLAHRGCWIFPLAQSSSFVNLCCMLKISFHEVDGGLGQFCSSFISRANDVICRLQLVGQAFWFSVIHYGNGYSAAYTFPSTETKPQNMCWWDAHMIAKWMEKPRKKKIVLIQVLGGSISMAMRIYVAQASTLDFKKSQSSTFLFTRSVRFM